MCLRCCRSILCSIGRGRIRIRLGRSVNRICCSGLVRVSLVVLWSSDDRRVLDLDAQDRASVVVGFWYYSPYLRGRACCPVLHETSAISSGILVNRLPCNDPGVRA